MDRRQLLTLAVGGGVSLLGGCSRPRTAASPTGPATVQLGDTVQGSNPMVTAERYFADQVAGLTKGRYQVNVQPGGVLGDDNLVTEMVRTGQVAFAKTPMGNLTAYDKRLGVLALPYAFTGEQQCLAMLDGELGRRCTSILSESGLAVLAYFYGGDRNLYNAKRPIHEPADLKGMRIRVPQNIVSIDMINAMGGSAVPMATNDVLSALQQHVVDGAEDSAVFYVAERHVLHARYYSRSRHQQSVEVLIGSWKWLSEQPSDIQDAILVAGRRAQAEEVRLWNEAGATALSGAKSQGALVNDVDVAAFQRAVAAVVDEHRGTFGDLAALLPGG